MKYIITALLFTFLLLSCNTNKGKIEVHAHLFRGNNVGMNITEIPIQGIIFTIDTIANTIHASLKDIVGKDFITSQLEEKFFPYYNSETSSIDYKITSIEHKPKGMIFNTQYEDKTFKCGLLDSVFSVVLDNGMMYMYIGGNQAKESNKIMNEAKLQVFNILTGQ